MSNKDWFQQRLRDPFFLKAHRDKFRSRAAYKLKEILEKYRFIKPGNAVLDLGAAPGSWTQVALTATGKSGLVVGIDLLAMEELEGARLLKGDIRDPEMQREIKELAPHGFHCILSDMAPNTTGVHHADTSNSAELIHLALDLCAVWLRFGGSFTAKIFEGAEYKELHMRASRLFGFAKSYKPKASLAKSREIYLVCQEYRGEGKDKRPEASAKPEPRQDQEENTIGLRKMGRPTGSRT
ncbi:MAG: RlmE family RNA methyltransferase [Candidatus Ozemobacteraceae bacterium]